MAKATEKDMNTIGNLAGILGDIDRGYYPRKANGDQPEEEPTFFDPADADHLRIFYDRVNECLEASPGGLFRVVGGFHTLMHNDIVDPGKDYLSLSPEIIKAKEISAATEAAIRDYHFALDNREHGAVAMDKALNEIESALGLPWRQGEELDRRKAV